jgi:hypothetical protein
LVQGLLEIFDLTYHEIINGLVLGFSLACIYDSEKNPWDK